MRGKRITAAVLTACFLAMTTAGVAAVSSLESHGVRFYTPDGWLCLSVEDAAFNTDAQTRTGVPFDVMQSYLRNSGILFYVMDASNNVFTFRREAPPAGLTEPDVFSLTFDQKNIWLDACLQKNSTAKGYWDDAMPGFFYIETGTEKQGLTQWNLSFKTLRYGEVFSFEFESFGAYPNKNVLSSLRTGAESVLFLAAKDDKHASFGIESLPDLDIMMPEGVAEQKVQRSAVPLTLDPIPSIVYQNSLYVTGTTQPDVGMRYYLNGKGVERFRADANGQFGIMIRHLKEGRNVLRIDAIDGGKYGVISMPVIMVKTAVPVALPTGEIITDLSLYTLYGRTLPEAVVTISEKKKATSIPVRADGSFAISIRLESAGHYTFTLTLTAEEYKKNTLPINIQRMMSQQERAESFRKEMSGISDSVLPGVIADLLYINSRPVIVFDADNGERYLVEADNFLCIDKQMRGVMLMIPAGDTEYAGQRAKTARMYIFEPSP